MAICKFWVQDRCNKGANCRFEHPPRPGSFQSGPQNRFAPLQNGGGNQSSNGRGASSSNASLPFSLRKDFIRDDLSIERPQWILSAYGPGRNAPQQLFGGSLREQSFEEMRLHHYQAAAAGHPQRAVEEARALVNQAEQQMQAALSNIDGAVTFIIDGEKTHPNRNDVCLNTNSSLASNTSPAPAAGAFGQSTTISAAGSAFNQPSHLGGGASGFGKPTQLGQPASGFGQPSQLGVGAPSPFGQPSQLGGAAAFGQPSGLGQGTSAFGKPSILAAASSTGTGSTFGSGSQATNGVFGQPSQALLPGGFGQPSQAPPATGFGQPSQPPAATGFGQPSQPPAATGFGQPSQPPAATGFGQPSQPPAANGFGQPSQPPPSTGFGQPSQPPASSAFGRPSQAPVASGFGQPSLGPPSASGFGKPPAPPTASVFGKPSEPQASPFGGVSASTAQSSNPFGQPAKPALANPFAAAGQTSGTQTGISPFGSNSQLGADPSAARGSGAAPQAQSTDNVEGPYAPRAKLSHPDPGSYSTHDASGKLVAWKAKPVQIIDGVTCFQRADDGKWEKIWFPDGPPAYNACTEAAPELYDDKTRDAYLFAQEHGVFKDGWMPELPPLREWCRWDF